ncbi:MAG: LysR family transcriptional regulator [Rhodospirillales bacterium]|jgi:DNA-binding transcriptional LysR family regulator|nr:LysR family transcriptional regulator [Rhodospirillales bacterium]
MTPNINLDSTALRYFQVAAEFKSVRRAAEALNVSASALSRQIAGLEQSLDVMLFERLPRGLRLTSAGEILLYHVARSFLEVGRAFNQIDALKGLRRGHIKVVSVESAARSVLATGLSAFWKKHRNLEVSVKVVGNIEALRLLEEGEADLGIAFCAPRSTSLPVLSVATLYIGAIMSTRHPLAGRSVLLLQDLAGYPLLLSDSSLMLNAALSDALATVPLSVRLVTNSITLMSILAASEDGVALKTRAGLAQPFDAGELGFVPIADRVLPLQHLAILTRRGLPLPALAHALGQDLKVSLDALSESAPPERTAAS